MEFISAKKYFGRAKFLLSFSLRPICQRDLERSIPTPFHQMGMGDLHFLLLSR